MLSAAQFGHLLRPSFPLHILQMAAGRNLRQIFANVQYSLAKTEAGYAGKRWIIPCCGTTSDQSAKFAARDGSATYTQNK
jgi:hypothetical protein